MKTGGYIRVHRSLLDHGLWHKRPFAEGQAWLDLLLLAAWKDHPEGYGRLQRRGQVFNSEIALALRWDWSRSAVRRFLTRLQTEGMITAVGDRRRGLGGTIITILNYDRFQGDERPSDSTGEGKPDRPSSGHQTNIKPASNGPSERPSNLIGADGPNRPSNDAATGHQRDAKPAITEEERSKEEEKESENSLRQISEQIYLAYPRHVGKDDALKAILRILKTCTITPAALLAKVQEFANSPAGKAGRFTPHPATWFNAGRYEDDPAEWQRQESGQRQSGLHLTMQPGQKVTD